MDPNLLSPTEQKTLQILEDKTILKNGHYEKPLPWKSEPQELPKNGTLAEKRFQSLENKFGKNPELTEICIEYIDLGHALKLTNDHSLNISDITNYVPHHGVLNINKPGRVRVVFDASTKYNDTCLNQNLLPGPDLLNNFVSVLIRFRQAKYAAMADKEKMFHQIFVSPNDTNALRFLWWEIPDEVVSDNKMLVHIFGKVDSPCCTNWALRKVPEMVEG